MPAISSMVNWLNTRRLRQIGHFADKAAGIQRETLYRLLNKASSTEWGRRYNYQSITSVSKFQSTVPVQSYENLEPFVERMGKGEADLLWPGKIKWFAKSSGTTSSRSKFIPVTYDSLHDCHYRGAKDILALYTSRNPGTRIFHGKGLTLGGSHRIDHFSSHAMCGDLSAILIENLPFGTDFLRTPVKKIALIEDFEKKLELITATTVRQNITSMAGVPSWYLTLIKHVLSYTGKSNLLDVWPNLEVFFHGGISFVPYREIYRELIKSDRMRYMETYNASEGFFGIQDDHLSQDMLLMLDYGIFYEFIPPDKMPGEPLAACTVDDVETGVNYAMVISSNGGLWRYLIGDTIVFTGKRPLRFRISGRTKHFINAFGEEVIIDNAEKALEAACKATGAVVSEYTAGPVFMNLTSKGSHEWIIEFEKDPSDILHFTIVLDDTLRSVNSDYDAKRFRDINLGKPLIKPVPAGTFNTWMKSRNKLGGQNKVPRLSNSREYIEEIIALIKPGATGK
jgi:hypothetical protein